MTSYESQQKVLLFGFVVRHEVEIWLVEVLWLFDYPILLLAWLFLLLKYCRVIREQEQKQKHNSYHININKTKTKKITEFKLRNLWLGAMI